MVGLVIVVGLLSFRKVHFVSSMELVVWVGKIPVGAAPEFTHSEVGTAMGSTFPLAVYVTKYCVWYVPVIKVGCVMVEGRLSLTKMHCVSLVGFVTVTWKVPFAAVPEFTHSDSGRIVESTFPSAAYVTRF